MPTQFAETVTPVLPLAPEVHPEPPSYRRIQVRKHMWRLAEAKVLTPTPEIARQGRNQCGQAYATGPSGQVPHSPFKPEKRLGRDAPVAPVVGETKT